jgi:hemerythrin superfamily protein
MENLKCYAESLNALCVKATNNTDELIDLADFLTQYSKIIYPLLIWNLYYYKTNSYSQFSINDFCEIVKIDIALDNYIEILSSLKTSIAKKLSIISNENITDFSKQLALLGLNETNAYLFMNGHALYDFIKAFLTKICEVLKNNRKYEIQELAENLPEDKRTETCNSKIGEYFKLVSVGYLLEHNDNFADCFLFQKIKTDIENYLETFKQQTQGLNHV